MAHSDSDEERGHLLQLVDHHLLRRHAGQLLAQALGALQVAPVLVRLQESHQKAFG
jgi:hypothetical protein